MQVLARRDVANVPLLVLANKSDKASASEGGRLGRAVAV